MSIIQNDVNNEAKNFGIEIVDVRIKRADLPRLTVTRYTKECKLNEEAKEFRAQGAEIAQRLDQLLIKMSQ